MGSDSNQEQPIKKTKNERQSANLVTDGAHPFSPLNYGRYHYTDYDITEKIHFDLKIDLPPPKTHLIWLPNAVILYFDPATYIPAIPSSIGSAVVVIPPVAPPYQVGTLLYYDNDNAIWYVDTTVPMEPLTAGVHIAFVGAPAPGDPQGWTNAPSEISYLKELLGNSGGFFSQAINAIGLWLRASNNLGKVNLSVYLIHTPGPPYTINSVCIYTKSPIDCADIDSKEELVIPIPALENVDIANVFGLAIVLEPGDNYDYNNPVYFCYQKRVQANIQLAQANLNATQLVEIVSEMIDVEQNVVGYVPCIPTDLGKLVTGSVSGANGVLVAYNNVTRVWKIQYRTTNAFVVGDVCTIAGGAGVGTILFRHSFFTANVIPRIRVYPRLNKSVMVSDPEGNVIKPGIPFQDLVENQVTLQGENTNSEFTLQYQSRFGYLGVPHTGRLRKFKMTIKRLVNVDYRAIVVKLRQNPANIIGDNEEIETFDLTLPPQGIVALPVGSWTWAEIPGNWDVKAGMFVIQNIAGAARIGYVVKVVHTIDVIGGIPQNVTRFWAMDITAAPVTLLMWTNADTADFTVAPQILGTQEWYSSFDFELNKPYSLAFWGPNALRYVIDGQIWALNGNIGTEIDVLLSLSIEEDNLLISNNPARSVAGSQSLKEM